MLQVIRFNRTSASRSSSCAPNRTLFHRYRRQGSRAARDRFSLPSPLRLGRDEGTYVKENRESKLAGFLEKTTRVGARGVLGINDLKAKIEDEHAKYRLGAAGHGVAKEARLR